MKQPYICANLVYGQLYPALWLENHLKSLIDPTNLPALRERYDVEYALYTDEATLNAIKTHQNFIKLSQIVPINVVKLTWPADADQFASRYNLLVQMLQSIIKVGLEKKAWLSVLVADLVFAKHSLGKILKRLDAGHDAVFNVPIRSAADSVNPLLHKLPGAPSELELFEMAYRNLHHLWVHSQWQETVPMFSKFPYSMLWNSGTGLCAHNFGITPIAFKPNEDMLKLSGGIDSDLPGMCRNPYWATDWTDAAVAGVEPLSNGHYPPFVMEPASVDGVCRWAKSGVYPGQFTNLDKPLYYPSRAQFNAPELAAAAQETALAIQTKLKQP